jgi:hypothetical protein
MLRLSSVLWSLTRRKCEVLLYFDPFRTFITFRPPPQFPSEYHSFITLSYLNCAQCYVTTVNEGNVCNNCMISATIYE